MSASYGNLSEGRNRMISSDSAYDPFEDQVDQSDQNNCKCCLSINQAFWATFKFIFSIGTAVALIVAPGYHCEQVFMFLTKFSSIPFFAFGISSIIYLLGWKLSSISLLFFSKWINLAVWIFYVLSEFMVWMSPKKPEIVQCIENTDMLVNIIFGSLIGPVFLLVTVFHHFLNNALIARLQAQKMKVKLSQV